MELLNVYRHINIVPAHNCDSHYQFAYIVISLTSIKINVEQPTVLLWKLITMLLDMSRKFLLMKHPWFIRSWELQRAQLLCNEEVISCTRRSTCVWNVAFKLGVSEHLPVTEHQNATAKE